MKPEIKLEGVEHYRRCYCCGEQSAFDLIIGHRSADGYSGNMQAVSLCHACRKLVADVLR